MNERNDKHLNTSHITKKKSVIKIVTMSVVKTHRI